MGGRPVYREKFTAVPYTTPTLPADTPVEDLGGGGTIKKKKKKVTEM